MLVLSGHGIAQTNARTQRSTLELKSSDTRLVQSFTWAKQQALAYVNDGDPAGPWYEAALPGRQAFCMRDFSHQVMGAQALGLAAQNKNMLTLFVQGVAASRDWASFWEIDRDGKPSPADYLSDDDFWYNLPANFDVMGAAFRIYAWTGDSSYIEDPAFFNFYRHTVTDYIYRWQLRPDNVLTRSRIMNRRLATGKFVDARGIPGYTESRSDFNLGTDLLAAEYRALRLYGELLRFRRLSASASSFDAEASGIAHILATRAWDSKDHHFYNALSLHSSGVGKGDAFILYFQAATNPSQKQMALDELKKAAHELDPGIEEQSYRPEILLHGNAPEEAYNQILDLSRPGRARREYPEVSYAVIGAIVNGMMGVNVVPANSNRSDDLLAENVVIQTLPRLSEHTAEAELDNLPIRGNVINLSNVRNHGSTMTNVFGPAFTWRASFDGVFPFLRVNEKKVKGKREMTWLSTPVTYVDVVLSLGQTVTVSR
jgi:hypothetical protein